MTTETIHTCSYECERPACIRAQRDDLVARLTTETSNARREVVMWAVVGNKSGAVLNVSHGTPEKMADDSAYWPQHGFNVRQLDFTAPPPAAAIPGDKALISQDKPPAAARGDDEDGLPFGFADWYNREFRTRGADTKHLNDCEGAWRAALTGERNG